MQQRIALVTGAGRGIGTAITKGLAAEGFIVVATARNTAMKENVENSGSAVVFHQLDVTDAKGIATLARFIENNYGRLDVLVNNAGILLNSKGFVSASMDEIRQTMETNFFGPVMLCKAMYPLLSKSADARVINVSSQMGSISSMGSGTAAYRLSKAALNGLTAVMAAEMGSSIKVNSMHPGWVRSDMGGKGASLSLEEGADTAIWLATAKGIPTGKFFTNRREVPW